MIRSLPRRILGRNPSWIEVAGFSLVFGVLGIRASGIPLSEHWAQELSAPRVARELAQETEKDAELTLTLPQLPLLHSHNDYERPKPLEDALAAGMNSVEADLWLGSEGQLEVSHTGFLVRGELEELYLRPLLSHLARQRTQNSVQGDGKRFYLWLDLKEDSPELIAAVEKALARYERILTRFKPVTEGGAIEREGAVTVILTGSTINKRRYTEAAGPRLASRDSSGVSPDDPPAVPASEWSSLRWSSEFHWTGVGRMPEEEREKLSTLVQIAHSRGRKIRIYGAPESEAYWREAARVGVDMIGADSIRRLGKLGRSWADTGR